MTEIPTYTASTVCAVTGVKPATLRAWRNRTGLLELEKGDRRRQVVSAFKSQIESEGADASWVDRTWDQLESQEKGWTRYTYRDLLSACALAEVTRHGLQPADTKKLRGAIVRDMVEQKARPPSGPRYLMEDQVSISSADTPKRLAHRFMVNTDDAMHPEATMFIVVDTAKLLRRILRMLAELGQPIPGQEAKP
jgi:hypothetical protein